MGTSSSMVNQIEFQVQFHMLFLGDEIQKLELLLRKRRSARRSFISFVQTGKWVDRISTQSNKHDSVGQKSLWKRYGYKDPFGICYSPPSSTNKHNPQGTTVSIDTDAQQSSSKPIGKWTLFHGHERSFLCFILGTLFLQSEEYQLLQRKHSSSGNAEDNIASHETLCSAKCETNGSQGMSGLLRHLLVTVESLAEGELDCYLADPTYSWVEDFTAAMMSLPLSLLVSTVDTRKHESNVFFVNKPPPQKGDSGLVEEHGLRSWSATVGRDLHSLCAEDLSPGGARQVETAIFNAKGYKVAIMNGKACKLRAIRPMRSVSGDYTYAVALETTYFPNPQELGREGLFEQSMEPFQQVEDLIAVLSLIIKV